MLSADNFLSNVLFTENNAFHILGFIDVTRRLSNEEIDTYVNDIVRKNTILRQYIVKINGELFLENDPQFDIQQQYSIVDSDCCDYTQTTRKLLNTPFLTKCNWFLSAYTTNTTTRIYIKIDHTLADGHQLLKIIASPFVDERITERFHRTKPGWISTAYYWIVGTILLILTLLKFVFQIVFQRRVVDDVSSDVVLSDAVQKTKIIEFDSFSLSAIKQITSRHNVTINDFMYAVALKSSLAYTKKKNIYTVSPINVSKTEHTNNSCPLLLNVAYSDNNRVLLANVHEAFNNCKYSLFVPGFAFGLQALSDYVNPTLLSTLYRLSADNIDLVYSNVIGPDVTDDAYKDTFVKDVNNMSFTINAERNQLCYTVISCSNKMNLIVSFQDGFVKDEAFLKRCVNDAYNSFM
jgi:hypothetical protein